MKQNSSNSLRLGGFCGNNSGTIENSYSFSKFFKSKNKGSFCFKNSGEINTCFSKGLSKRKKIHNFIYENKGKISHSFYDSDDNLNSDEVIEDNVAISCNYDKTSALSLKEDYDLLLDNFWEYDDKSNLIDLKLKSKTFDTSQIEKLKNTKPITIKTLDDLFSISNKINSGDTEVASLYYILGNDIDLKGKKWIPLGNVTCPFTGVFDGNGHKIYNFKVYNKNLMCAGFFGVTENAIIANLHVDGIIRTGTYTGGFVGINKGSKICSCSARGQVIGKGYVGGFVGYNSGTIVGSYYQGKMRKPIPLIWISLIPLSGLIGLICLYVYNPMRNNSVFNNVPIDPYLQKTSGKKLFTGDKNKASFRFSDIIRFNNGVADFDFGNPDVTNQSMTIKIQVTDEELLKKIGKTGRTKQEQSKLDANSNYDPSNARVTVSESGLVLPGYDLKKLVLNNLPDGSLLPKGVYNGIAFLNFFNYETNEKAIINSQVPVSIVVE